jgi:hypothetical protein
VGEPLKAEVSGDTGEHDFDVGSPVPIEYDRPDPARAQITWIEEEGVSDASFGKWFNAIAALTLLGGGLVSMARLRSPLVAE